MIKVNLTPVMEYWRYSWFNRNGLISGTTAIWGDNIHVIMGHVNV